MTPRRAACLAAATLFVVYVATLAPSVTFWDAGEFIAAARRFGIPHPPGTPLFVALLTSAGRVLWFLPFAVATNLVSALSTAAAVGLTAFWIGRATGSSLGGFVAGLTAGGMTSVWQNATETEVYAASLCLAVGAILAADQAGRSGERRWVVLAGYLLALSLPLHLSALVAAPVVILLAIERLDGTRDWRAGLALLGVSVCVAGVGRLSWALIVVGFVMLGVSGLSRRETAPGRSAVGPLRALGMTWAMVVPLLATGLIACSALLIMLVRARHDPPINQDNPTTLAQLGYAVARKQYAVQGLWPRQAPWWLQIANWFEYADWQFALSLGPTVIPTVSRTLVTIGYAALAVFGAWRHHARDRRTWRATLLLLLCGSLGVIAYLNLKAGTSFAWQFAPGDAQHEARDRDYFFVLGFWAWGMWAGMGAVALAQRLRVPAVIGALVAGLPIVLNVSAVERRSEPEASMPRELAHMLLDPLPPHAVLFVGGDNDTYPLWYVQQVEGQRGDVTVVTMPLLAAPWYVDELRRRAGLRVDRPYSDVDALAAQVASAARSVGRPVAAALTVPAADRDRLSRRWKVIGLDAIDQTTSSPAAEPGSKNRKPVVQIDTPAVLSAAVAVENWRGGREAHPATDPVNEYFLSVLECPRMLTSGPRTSAQLASLDSLCNLR